LHREWFDRCALPDLLHAEFALADSHKLYADTAHREHADRPIMNAPIGHCERSGATLA
jgi:hypothetical protein